MRRELGADRLALRVLDTGIVQHREGVGMIGRVVWRTPSAEVVVCLSANPAEKRHGAARHAPPLQPRSRGRNAVAARCILPGNKRVLDSGLPLPASVSSCDDLEDEVRDRTSNPALSFGRRVATPIWLFGAVVVVLLVFLPAWVSYDRVVTNPTELTVGREHVRSGCGVPVVRLLAADATIELGQSGTLERDHACVVEAGRRVTWALIVALLLLGVAGVDRVGVRIGIRRRGREPPSQV